MPPPDLVDEHPLGGGRRRPDPEQYRRDQAEVEEVRPQPCLGHWHRLDRAGGRGGEVEVPPDEPAEVHGGGARVRGPAGLGDDVVDEHAERDAVGPLPLLPVGGRSLA